jgi:Flp pilus assembly protein TadD
MTQRPSGLRSSGPLIGALAGVCVLMAGTTGAWAAKSPPTAAESRAELLKKLSPAEVMEAGDQAARSGDFERAITLYNQGIEAQPSADLWYRVAWIYARLGKKQQAADAYAMTLKYDDKHAMALEELGLLYLENKRRETGIVYLSRAVEADPARWRSHNALGVLADTSGDHASAIGHYQAALAVNAGSAMVLNNLGYSHYLAGDMDEAEKLYKQALELEPANRAVRVNTGLLHARRGNYALAVEVMSAAMDKARSHNDVGYVAFQNGDMEAAEKLLLEAIRLSPSYYETAQQNLKRVTRARDAATATATPVAPAPELAARDAG